MVDLSFLVPTAPWFVAFADDDAAAALAATIRAPALRVIAHGSGRPWLVGRWERDAARVIDGRAVRVALLGSVAGAAGAVAALDAARTVEDVDAFASRLRGSAHLVACAAGEVRVQGGATGLRRVYTAVVGGVPIAGDRSDVIAAVAGGGVDGAVLAARLLWTEPPWPVAWRSVWRSVRALPPDRYAVLGGPDGPRERRWWEPPPAHESLATGAAAFRTELRAAVAVATDGSDPVSCDLSGLDSSSLCALAAQSAPRVQAYTLASPDPMHDDVEWARRTAAALGTVRHEVVPPDPARFPYAGLTRLDQRTDEPFPGLVERATFAAHMGRIAATGSGVHLWGMGGDEVATTSLAQLHPLARAHPVTALRLLRAYAAKTRTPAWRAVREVASRGSYRQCLTAAAHRVADGARPNPLDLGWAAPPRVAPWVTPAAVEQARALLRRSAPGEDPVGRNRGEHAERTGVHLTAAATRQFTQYAAQFGVTLAAPYLDDRVWESSLAVRPADKLVPGRYKPLLVDAMRGIVPDVTLTRTTKAEGSTARILGFSAHCGEVLALAEDSRLAGLGLVDGTAFRDACRRPIRNVEQWHLLDMTLAVEGWLRTVEGRT